MKGKTRIILLFVSLLSLACAQTSPRDEKAVVMAPVAVTAGPLGYLGIIFDLDVDVGFFSHVSDSSRIKAMVVSAVTPGSPAHFAGLMPTDRVLRLDGIPITEYTIGALKGIREKEKGDKAVFVVASAGSKPQRTIEVIVGTRKSPQPSH